MRNNIALINGWKFQADQEGTGHINDWHKDGLSEGHAVRVPHSWNVEDGLENFRGAGWYEYQFQADEEWKTKTVRILFEAVYRDATVWLNGSFVGEHDTSGYTAFTLDLTPELIYDKPNLLVIRVNNKNCNQSLPYANSFDWADDGGLIRDVSLLISGNHAIDYAKLRAIPEFTADGESFASGKIDGTVYFDRLDPVCRPSMSVSLWRDGVLVVRDSYELEINPDGLSADLKELRIDRVDLWHFDHPNLYTVRLTVEDELGVSDEIEVFLGFREIIAEGNRLLINREPVRLIGIEWMPGSNPDVGMSESMEDISRSLQQIKEANCVITRFHWQQDSRLLEWCDRNGLLVQEEIPHWQKPAIPTEDFLPISIRHAQEMIDRHYNHPSVFAWGMGNEIDGTNPQSLRYFGMLKEEMKKLDSTRFINYVSNSLHLEPANDATRTGDIIMWNDYIGTWHGELDRSSTIRSISTANPGKPLIVAEYGLCEPAYSGGDVRRTEILINNTNEYRKHPEIAAVIFFSLNDYRTQMGEDGDGRMRCRVHGTTSLYGVPKPSYYALREQAAPIRILAAKRLNDKGISITLAVQADIPCYAIRGYRLHAMSDNELETTLPVPDMVPGETQCIVIPEASSATDVYHIRIERPNGFVVLDSEIRLT